MRWIAVQEKKIQPFPVTGWNSERWPQAIWVSGLERRCKPLLYPILQAWPWIGHITRSNFRVVPLDSECGLGPIHHLWSIRTWQKDLGYPPYAVVSANVGRICAPAPKIHLLSQRGLSICPSSQEVFWGAMEEAKVSIVRLCPIARKTRSLSRIKPSSWPSWH